MYTEMHMHCHALCLDINNARLSRPTHSCLSLASEDADSPESLHAWTTSGSYGNVSGVSFDARPSPTKPSLLDHFQGLQGYGSHSSPASLAGSLMDIPVVLVNGAPPTPDPSRPVTPPSEPPKPSIPHGECLRSRGAVPEPFRRALTRTVDVFSRLSIDHVAMHVAQEVRAGSWPVTRKVACSIPGSSLLGVEMCP